MKNRFLIGACFAAVACLVPAAFAFKPPVLLTLSNYDKRATLESTEPDANQEKAAAELTSRFPGVIVSWDRILGVPHLIAAQRGFLTGPVAAGQAMPAAALAAVPVVPVNEPQQITKGFLQERAALFGYDASVLEAATVARDFVTAHNGLRSVVWQQTLRDIPIFEAVFMSHVTRNGELVSVASGLVPDREKAAAGGTPNYEAMIAQPTVSAAQALVLASRNLGTEVNADSVVATQGPDGPEKSQKFTGQPLVGEADVELSWLPTSRDSMRLCWRVELTTRTRPELYSLLVDIETGEILVRHCLTEYIQPATYNVYTNDSPSPFTPGLATPSSFQPPFVNRTLVTITALNTNASPNGWINDG
ncbi:MAG TPA: hypothetical protein VFA77_13005, partial [Candidatus Eisenbacteria bacterium]|nr:hypothetical protein [Candidatus Eisenbacteria bacterium]